MTLFEKELRALGIESPLWPKNDMEVGLAQAWFDIGQATKVERLEKENAELKKCEFAWEQTSRENKMLRARTYDGLANENADLKNLCRELKGYAAHLVFTCSTGECRCGLDAVKEESKKYLNEEMCGMHIGADPGMDDSTVRVETKDGEIVSIINLTPTPESEEK